MAVTVTATTIGVGASLPAPTLVRTLVIAAPPLTVGVSLPAAAVLVAGSVTPPPVVTIAIDGVSSPVVPFESLRIEETLAYPGPGPSTASFTIVDLAADVTIKPLADVTISDGSEVLFRGQVIRTTSRPTAHYRRIGVECVSYDRYAAASPVGVPIGGGSSYQPPDASTATIPYDERASSAYLGGGPVPDKTLFGHFVDVYWRGPETDATTHVRYTISVAGDHWWPDTTLDVVFDDLCALVGPGWTWFLRPDLAWWFGPLSDNRGPGSFSDEPDDVLVFPTYDLAVVEDGSEIVGAAYVRGGLPSGSGWIDPNPYLDEDVAYAPASTISVASRNSAERTLFAAPELSRRGTTLPTLTWSTVGTSGWHRGQVVRVVNAAVGIDADYVLRSVVLTMLSADSVRRYDFQAGDRRSLQLTQRRDERRSERAVDYDRTKADPATRFVCSGMWGDLNVVPDGKQDTLVAQLVTSDGEPRQLAGVSVSWQVWRDGTQLSSNSGAGDPGGDDGAFLAAPTSETDILGRAYNNWYMVDHTAGVFDVTVLAT